MSYKKINNIEELKKLSLNQDLSCFISLVGGIVRSSKNIFYNGKKFEIVNEIDNTDQLLTQEELYTESNIGEALDKGALYKY